MNAVSPRPPRPPIRNARSSEHYTAAAQCLYYTRSLLARPDMWGKGGEATLTKYCPLTANTAAIEWYNLQREHLTLTRLSVFERCTLRTRLLWCLWQTVPASHFTWWPSCVTRYNDDPHTTLDDVLAWLDRAIAKQTGDKLPPFVTL